MLQTSPSLSHAAPSLHSFTRHSLDGWRALPPLHRRLLCLLLTLRPPYPRPSWVDSVFRRLRLVALLLLLMLLLLHEWIPVILVDSSPRCFFISMLTSTVGCVKYSTLTSRIGFPKGWRTLLSLRLGSLLTLAHARAIRLRQKDAM